jgi:dolichol kinase
MSAFIHIICKMSVYGYMHSTIYQILVGAEHHTLTSYIWYGWMLTCHHYHLNFLSEIFHVAWCCCAVSCRECSRWKQITILIFYPKNVFLASPFKLATLDWYNEGFFLYFVFYPYFFCTVFKIWTVLSQPIEVRHCEGEFGDIRPLH